MKKGTKIIIISFLCVVVLVLLGFLGYFIYIKKTYISKDVVKEMILNDTKLNKNDITFKKINLEKNDELDVYDVEFYYNKVEYKYEINAKTGEIIKSDFTKEVNDTSDTLFTLGLLEKAKKSALGTEGLNLIDFAKTAYQLEQMKPASKIKSDSSVCFSLEWLHANDYFAKGIEDNYTGSVLINFDNTKKEYNYLFWISDGVYAFNKENLNEYSFQNAIEKAYASDTCDNQANIICSVKGANSSCDYK